MFISTSSQVELTHFENSTTTTTVSDSLVDSFIPITMKDVSEIDVELLTPLTIEDLKKNHIKHSVEKNDIEKRLSKNEYKKDLRIFYDHYNQYYYRKLNEETITNVNDKDTSIRYVYKQDIEQELYGKRYILRCKFSINLDESIASFFEPNYYLFDTQTKIRYLSFESISLFLKAVDYNKNHTPTASILKGMTAQEYLDQSIRLYVINPSVKK